MRSPNTAYVSRLDHLRFYAAALVVLYHYFQRFAGNVVFSNPLGSLINEGHVGIGLFMVLSGFIFSVIANGKTIQYGRFMLNRVIRIYPLYVFAVVLAVTLMVYNEGQHSRGIFDIFGWLLAFRPPTIVEVPYFPHLWTIPVEFSFYLLFPFLHAFFQRYGLKYFAGLLVFLFIVRSGVYLEYGSVRYVAYETLFGRLDQFLIGYVSGWLYAQERVPKTLSSPLALAGAVALLLATVSWLNHHGGSLNFEAAWWIVWPFIEGLAWAALVLTYLTCRWRWPQWLDHSLASLGALSFSIYVVHLFVVSVVGRHIGLLGLTEHLPLDILVSCLLTAFPLTLLVATLSYLLIEKPFLAYRVVYARPIQDGAPAATRTSP